MAQQKLTKKQNIMQAVKFTLFSISAGVIQIGIFTLLNEVFGLQEWAFTHLPALICSVLWNFTFNRRYTFKSATNVPIAMAKVALFYLAFTPASYFGGKALLALGWNNYLVEGLMMITNFITEFLYCKFFVYRNNMNTNDIAKKQEEKEA